MNVWRQGDVVIRPGKIPSEAEKQNHLTLAEGEVTGHSHRVTKGQAELYRTVAGLMFLRVISEYATLHHEEHDDIMLPIGDYEVKGQREWDWYSEGMRGVAD